MHVVLNDFRSQRRNELAMSYVDGVADKFGGDVAGALRTSANLPIPGQAASGAGLMQNNSLARSSGGANFRNSGSTDFSERKGNAAGSSYSGRLPPMSSRISGGISRRTTRGAGGSARTVADILAEHKERSRERQQNRV